MGFPTKMFTVLFALGRLPGWIAQWREMIEDKQTKIGRPRQVYVGSPAARLRRPSRSADGARPVAPRLDPTAGELSLGQPWARVR